MYKKIVIYRELTIENSSNNAKDFLYNFGIFQSNSSYNSFVPYKT